MKKFCPQCGENISTKMKFCPNCGLTLESQNSDQSEMKKNNINLKTIPALNTLTIIGICIFFILVFLIFVPTKTTTYSVEVAYTDTETYYEKEPFVVQESYQEKVPYQTTETYTDIVPVPVSVPYQDYEYSYKTYDSGTDKYYSSIPTGCVCSSNRYNYDKDGVYGALCVQLTCQIATPVTKYRTETQQQSIQKERPVTEYRTETKTRSVTQYQDVAKTRNVIKTRIEERPLEVNWLLGFKTPYSLHLPLISGK